MGDCASRPTGSEMDQHLRDYNVKNNRFFKQIPHATSHSEFILLENNIENLESRKSVYTKKYYEMLRRSEIASKTDSRLRELIIEVQKGILLDQQRVCILQGKPYVCVSLEPKGPYHDTFPSDLFKPVWYKVVEFKSLVDYKNVKFTIKISDSTEIHGTVSISLSDLKDQLVHDKWYQVKNTWANKSSLKIKIQYIENEVKLYQDLAKQCEVFIDDINQAIDKLILKPKE